MAAVAIAALAGVSIGVPDLFRRAAFTVMGATLGAGVSQSTLASLPTWPVSLMGLTICVLLLMIIAPWFLMRVYQFDRKTAVMSCVPGAFSFVLAFAEDIGADVRRVAVLQTVRLGALFIVVPTVLGFTGFGGETVLSAKPDMSLQTLMVLVVLAVLAGLIAHRLRLGAPEFVGSMAAGIALSGSGLLDGGVPLWFAWPGFIGTGIVIGTRFAGIDRALLWESSIAGLSVFAISAGITVIGAWLVAIIVGQPFANIWLAFAPGGLDTMSVLALSLGYDAAFVAGHQLLRFLALSLTLPFLLRRTLR